LDAYKLTGAASVVGDRIVTLAKEAELFAERDREGIWRNRR
jgi:hypothetical protein